MIQILNKKNILRAIFAVWIVLWVLFLVREGKDGQYSALKYLYTHSYGDKVRYVTGDKLYDFLVFCRQNIPKGSTYELAGFERFSIGKVRARYFLWPLKGVGENADFKILYGKKDVKTAGYKEYKRYGGTGRILARKDKGR